MMTCMKYLLPISCILLLGVSLWQVAMPPFLLPYFSYGLSALCVAGTGWLAFKLVTTPSKLPASGMTSPWALSTAPATKVTSNGGV
jgi:NADH-quinone oxidoreductase subunit H